MMRQIYIPKWVMVVLLSVIGGATAYYFGSQPEIVGWEMFWLIISGVAIGFFMAVSIYEKRKFTSVGFAIGIFFSILVNVLLKAKFGIQGILLLVFMTTYIGYCMHQKRRPIYIGGGIGGVLGFIFGFYASFSIGEISYSPGFIAAISIAISGILFGMFAGTGFSYFLDNKE